MKKVLFFSLALIAGMPLFARPLKERITHLEKQLKAHADSENKSWALLKNIDQRLYKMENRLSSCPAPEIFEEKEQVTVTVSPLAKKRKYRSARPGITGRKFKAAPVESSTKKRKHPGLTKLKKNKHLKRCAKRTCCS